MLPILTLSAGAEAGRLLPGVLHLSDRVLRRARDHQHRPVHVCHGVRHSRRHPGFNHILASGGESMAVPHNSLFAP